MRRKLGQILRNRPELMANQIKATNDPMTEQIVQATLLASVI
jgi:hypothetical protein